MKRSRSSFLKWLLVGPIMVIPACLLIWLSVTMTIRDEGIAVYFSGVVLGISGLILTGVGWFEKLAFHKHILNWMEK